MAKNRKKNVVKQTPDAVKNDGVRVVSIVADKNALHEATEQMRRDSYVPLMHGVRSNSVHETGFSDVLKATMCGGSDNHVCGDIGTEFVGSASVNMTGCNGIGTPDKGWIPYAFGNQLPNLIALLVQMSPYLSTAYKYNVDAAAGLGPVPRYNYTYYNAGNISTKKIGFMDAGALLQGQLSDLYRQLLNVYNGTTSAKDEDGNVVSNAGAAQARKMLIDALNEQIKTKKEEYEKWKTTQDDVQAFISRNNLHKTFLELFSDQLLMGNCYPELRLSKKYGKDAQAKVLELRHQPLTITRMEEMDGFGNINYVYQSNQWWDANVKVNADSLKLIAKPTINPNCPAFDLEEKLLSERITTKNTNDVKTTNYVLPLGYPTPGRPYYSVPSWHSLFAGCIYEYLNNIIVERNTRRKNKNVIGRIAYVHTDYLDQMFMQAGATTNEAKDRLRDELWDSINEFLSGEENHGKTFFAFTFTGTDGKEHESFRVVEITSAQSSAVNAEKTELEEIANIVLFAMEVNGDLVGARPGGTGAQGGTAQREMYLIKQVKMGTIQKLVLKALEVVSKINGWDEHLVWEIEQPRLTTLDESKTGITEG